MVHMYVSPLTLQLKWEIRTYAQQEYITDYEFAMQTLHLTLLQYVFFIQILV